jgi:hypothetical protein
MGSYATSYIKTTSSSATKVADACYKTGISSLIGQTEGTMFVYTQFAEHRLTGNDVWFMECVNDDTSNGILVYASNNNTVDVYINNSGSTITMTTSVNIKEPMKIALAYKSGEFALFINGILKDSKTTSFTFPSNINQFALSKWVGSPTEQKIAYNEALLFKTRLTNAELASLTTI